jgi:hypothetical protein
MIKKIWGVAAAAVLAINCAPASAKGIVIEANGARAHGEWGGELGLGYNLSMAGFTLRPIVGAFIYPGDNDRYYMDDVGSSERCRDSTNGQFADTDKCNNTAVKPYGKIEATYTIPLFAEIGAGARFSSDKVRPYGTASVPLGPMIRLKGNAGPKYYAAGLRVGF